MKTKTNNKGFTLVEIIIVFVVIGLLAAMAIPAFQAVRQVAIVRHVDTCEVYDCQGKAHAEYKLLTDEDIARIRGITSTEVGVKVKDEPSPNEQYRILNDTVEVKPVYDHESAKLKVRNEHLEKRNTELVERITELESQIKLHEDNRYF